MKYLGYGILGLVAILIIAQLFLPDNGVGFVTGLVVYLISWWMIFFAMLPIGVQGQQESVEGVVPGSEPGAPVNPMLGKKAWWTSQITGVFWLIFFVIVEFHLLDLEDLPTIFAPEPFKVGLISLGLN